MVGLVVWYLCLLGLQMLAMPMQLDVLEVEGAVRQWYFDVTGMSPHGGAFGNMSTGASITRADVELFTRLSTVFSPHRIFIVGNAWGYLDAFPRAPLVE